MTTELNSNCMKLEPHNKFFGTGAKRIGTVNNNALFNPSFNAHSFENAKTRVETGKNPHEYMVSLVYLPTPRTCACIYLSGAACKGATIDITNL